MHCALTGRSRQYGCYPLIYASLIREDGGLGTCNAKSGVVCTIVADFAPKLTKSSKMRFFSRFSAGWGNDVRG